MKIRALKLHDHDFGNQWFEEVENRWEYDDLRKDFHWRREWISMDSLLYNHSDDRIYLGITSFDNDIFRAYDRKNGEFIDLGYGEIADPFDAKFHRSLVKWENDGCIYGAIALLHDVNRYWDAPGGAIVRYDPESGDLRKIGIPIPHVYIQSICIDQKKGVLYGFTFTPERLFKFDLRSGKSRDLGPISSGMDMAQGENIELDAEGCAWCSWTVTRAWQPDSGVDKDRLCKYDPLTDRIQFFKTGLPHPDGTPGTVKVEGLFCLQEKLFASGGNGSLYRIDTEMGTGIHLGTPITDRPSRLTSLIPGPDGWAYGVTGRAGRCEVIRFNPVSEKHEILGPVKEGDKACWQVHDVAMTDDGVLYAAENDNPYRSGYLWEISL